MAGSYAPGDILIFLSGCLYHAVQFWEPAPPPPGAKLSAGQIGNVFFFPDNSFQKLFDKPEGWNADTMTGHFLLQQNIALQLKLSI